MCVFLVIYGASTGLPCWFIKLYCRIDINGKPKLQYNGTCLYQTIYGVRACFVPETYMFTMQKIYICVSDIVKAICNSLVGLVVFMVFLGCCYASWLDPDFRLLHGLPQNLKLYATT